MMMMNRRNVLVIIGALFVLSVVFIFSTSTSTSYFVSQPQSQQPSEKTPKQQLSVPTTESGETVVIEESVTSSGETSTEVVISKKVTPTFWNIEEPLFDSSAARIDSLKISSEVFAEKIVSRNEKFSQLAKLSDPDHPVGLRTRDFLLEKKCNPDRFIFVNTHTFGRHHNQLQEILHIIAFARRLNRTAILSFFRANHKWWGPGEFYDFDLLLKRECVVTPSEFKGLWSNLQTEKRARSSRAGRGGSDSPSAMCLGQGTKATPLAKVVKCVMAPNVPAHYSSKTGFGSTKETFYGKLILEDPTVRDADFLGVSGEIAFFMRPGIIEMSRLLASIKPSMLVKLELTNFFRGSAMLAPNAVVAKFWELPRATPGNEYFALHLRQREKDCLKEVNDNFEINPELPKKLSEKQQQFVRTQCAIPVSHVEENLLQRYEISRTATKFFLASDHENMVLEKSLVENHNAVMYSGKFDHKSLQGLAMDFFLLVGGKYFSGNQLSSISQNVCMMRLGLGLNGCHGCVVNYALQVYNPIDDVV